jgi:hypothetical protein
LSVPNEDVQRMDNWPVYRVFRRVRWHAIPWLADAGLFGEFSLGCYPGPSCLPSIERRSVNSYANQRAK